MPTYDEEGTGGVYGDGIVSFAVIYNPVNKSSFAFPFNVYAVNQGKTINKSKSLGLDFNGLEYWWSFNCPKNDVIRELRRGSNGIINTTDLLSRWTVDGERGGFVYVNDGSADYISVPNVLGIDNGDMLSFSLWVYLNVIDFQDQILLIKSDDVLSSGFAITWDIIKGFSAYIPDEDRDSGFTGVSGYTANVWYHVVVVYNGYMPTNAEKLKIYINGDRKTLGFSGTIPSLINPSVGNLNITGYGDDLFFNGKLDDIRQYNRPLTDVEILRLYNL